jgi:hypothetical protein
LIGFSLLLVVSIDGLVDGTPISYAEATETVHVGKFVATNWMGGEDEWTPRCLDGIFSGCQRCPVPMTTRQQPQYHGVQIDWHLSHCNTKTSPFQF